MGILIDPYRSADTDPYWSSVVLLLPLNGANGATTFPDASDAAESISAAGAAALSTAQKRFGTASVSLDGTADYLVADAASSNYDFGGGYFTIECWVYSEEAGRAQTIIGNYSGSNGWRLFKDSSNRLAWERYLSGSAQSMTSGATTIALNTWTHVAIARVENDLGTLQQRLFIDGVYTGGFISGTTNIGNSATILRIGADTVTAGRFFNGYIDDLRVTKGVGRYSEDFTAPASPYPTR